MTEREITGSTSDGHHTFDELYEYRMLYNAHAARGWASAGIPVVKSWRHADGQECFGGGWFIVTATPPTGQVSNHYEADHWDLFTVPEVETAPEWDGHTPAEAADRLRDALLDGCDHPAPERTYSRKDMARAWAEGQDSGRETASIAAHYGLVKIAWNPYEQEAA